MTTSGLLTAIETHADLILTDKQKVDIAKKKYLIVNKEEILQAVAEGYVGGLIAGVATEELLKTGVPRTFNITNKEGEEELRETQFWSGDIKKFCESFEVISQQ